MNSAARAWVALSHEAWVPPVEIAGLYLAAGMDDDALEWLERGFEEHDPNLGYILTWGPTIWGHLRDDPRLRDLVWRMNLPQ